ncbi:ankyrin repeat domain-containing protein 52 [Colletotrichum incanum]|uniref:Ankyrin repeat domain-containing protein 52 n=1 Tax=Colletotrichum incanum TaxID=1573173 RepID=A0A162PK77_COLIC|nr:ankyrin repeat domain-containing protein 52 [Colletotrichum incanum]
MRHEDVVVTDDLLPLRTVRNIESEILGLCGSLIEVRGAPLESSAGSRKIHLAHFSVKQYLLCKIPSRGAALFANESLRASNEVIEGVSLAKLCLRYIGFQRVWDGSLPEGKDRIGMSFQNYAAKYWYQHTDVSKAKDEALVEAMNALFDGRVQTWDSWRQWFDANGEDLKPQATETILPASRLYYASYLGLTGVVRYLIHHCKQDPNEKAKSGRAALEIACEKGYQEIAQMLLGGGADIDVTGHRGRTPVYAASMNGHIDLVKLLLDKGADITVANEDGWTPLNSASDSGHLEVVKLLLDKGADITVANEDGWTPLNSASDSGHLEVVKLLLDKGADITVADKDGWTPLSAASNTEGRTALSWAAMKGQEQTVSLLVKNSRKTLNFRDNKDYTPLIWALKRSHHMVVKVLSQDGCAIEESCKEELAFQAFNLLPAAELEQFLVGIGYVVVDDFLGLQALFHRHYVF